MTPAPAQLPADTLDVVIVDDAAAIRMLLRRLLDADPRFHVVGEAADGMEAVNVARSLHPDVVILDLVMPRLGGLAALPRLRRVAPHARVVVLSGADNPDAEDQARALGAVGFLEKGTAPDALIDGLLAVTGALDAVEEAVAESRSRLAPEVRSAGSARRFVEATLAQWGARSQLDIVKLLVSELVTNAVVHAHSEAEVVVRLTSSAVRVEVLDRSRDLPVVRQPAPTDVSGRGLALVEALATAWGVRMLPEGKAVWFEVPLAADPGRPG